MVDRVTKNRPSRCTDPVQSRLNSTGPDKPNGKSMPIGFGETPSVPNSIVLSLHQKGFTQLTENSCLFFFAGPWHRRHAMQRTRSPRGADRLKKSILGRSSMAHAIAGTGPTHMALTGRAPCRLGSCVSHRNRIVGNVTFARERERAPVVEVQDHAAVLVPAVGLDMVVLCQLGDLTTSNPPSQSSSFST